MSHVERGELRQAQAAGVEQLEQGAVAPRQRVVARHGHQALDLLDLQGARQRPAGARRAHVGGRIPPHPALAQQPGEQRPHRRQRARQRASRETAAVLAGDEALDHVGVDTRPVVAGLGVQERGEAAEVAPVGGTGGRRGIALDAQVVVERRQGVGQAGRGGVGHSRPRCGTATGSVIQVGGDAG